MDPCRPDSWSPFAAAPARWSTRLPAPVQSCLTALFLFFNYFSMINTFLLIVYAFVYAKSFKISVFGISSRHIELHF